MSEGRWSRVRDLSITLLPDGSFLLRAPARGLGGRAPFPAVELLSFASTPRSEADVAGRYGPPGVSLWRALVEGGWIVREENAHATPVFFENFASLDVHRRMLADRPRIDAYAAALAAVVRPGMAVLDAGTGTGVLACLAARAGARVVYAVDQAEILGVAAEVVRASGLADRVRLVKGDFGAVELPEPVDVIVTETFGGLALAENGLDDVARAAARHLKPGGVIVPRGLSLWVAPLGDPGPDTAALAGFTRQHDIALDALRPSALHRAVTTAIPAAALAHPGLPFAELALGDATGLPHAVARGEVELPVDTGTVYGLAAWFDLDLADGVCLSTGPAAPLTHWQQQLLPTEPIPVSGSLSLSLSVAPAFDDRRGVEVSGHWESAGRSGPLFHRVR